MPSDFRTFHLLFHVYSTLLAVWGLPLKFEASKDPLPYHDFTSLIGFAVLHARQVGLKLLFTHESVEKHIQPILETRGDSCLCTCVRRGQDRRRQRRVCSFSSALRPHRNSRNRAFFVPHSSSLPNETGLSRGLTRERCPIRIILYLYM